ncbi:MAG TPA: winged helix-turn-helix domain-containing protein [Nitrososphaera sp.]|nr:winged helix-turn-helix domain-containing protein [Nitrososphaera sp.]
MADTILQRNVRARRLVALDQKSAQALSDIVRMRILEVLGHRPMSAEELTKALGNAGHKKAITTVRHHLDSLKNAGLIEATKMVEVRGAVLKYYAPTVRAFSFAVPSKFEDTHARLILDTSARIQKILKGIRGDKKLVAESEQNGTMCSICKGNHFREYAVAEIVNHALVQAMDTHEHAENDSERQVKAGSTKP